MYIIDKPEKPTGPITFSYITNESVTLNWQPPAKDGGAPVTNYVIEYRDAKRTTWSKAGDVSADKTFFVADKLLTGNEYYFRVIAVNEEGQGQPLESLETVRPEKPIGEQYKPLLLVSKKSLLKKFDYFQNDINIFCSTTKGTKQSSSEES